MTFIVIPFLKTELDISRKLTLLGGIKQFPELLSADLTLKAPITIQADDNFGNFFFFFFSEENKS